MSLLLAISKGSGIPLSDLRRLVVSAPFRYKQYYIPKKRPGERRLIAQPSREVKEIQYWLLDNVLHKFPIHDAAMAYLKGRSIRDNAEQHAGTAYLLKLDFKDFFPSIKEPDITYYFSRAAKEFSPEDLQVLVRVLLRLDKGTRNLELSIGAPTSPHISNLLLYDFDSTVAEECAKKGIRYTRYADDMVFSTSKADVLRGMADWIKEHCDRMISPRLILNDAKTLFASKKYRRWVTGLVLTNAGGVSIGHRRKRELRAAVHHAICGDLDDTALNHLRGMLAFVWDVEPEFLNRLMNYYGRGVILQLLKS
jgi:retron-type reverse transcriptase